MSSSADSFSAYDELLAASPRAGAWVHTVGDEPVYAPDYELLGRLLTVPVAAGEVSESGRFARGLDAWLAHELRRAGFGADEVWPRATPPRVLARDLALLLDKLPRKLASDVRARLPTLRSVAPVDARILGRAYEKQVDVCISRWDRGPELLISTKAQLSSFAKNLPNRFEEAYGDAANLRSRYPLAAVGFFFLQRSTILAREPDAFERAVDMVRKLRKEDRGGGYIATALVLVEWDKSSVVARPDLAPEDVAPAQFLSTMVQHVLKHTPVTQHVAVRERFEGRCIPVTDDDISGR